MSTTLILPQDAPACADDAASVKAFIVRETEQLAAHLFATTYKMDWRAAWNQAIELLPDLLSWAAAWDASAAPPIVFALEAAHAAA